MNGLSRIRCVPVASRNVTAIAVYTVMSVVIVAAIGAVAALIVIRNRHALGPPGELCPAAVLRASSAGTPGMPIPLQSFCQSHHASGCQLQIYGTSST